MRISNALIARLSPLAVAAALLAGGCTPDYNDKLACVNSTQCPTGYYCASDGKCQQGDTSPELTLITPTSGVTFSGKITLQISAIDPAGISMVNVSLAPPGADAGAPVVAQMMSGNIYSVLLDTHALGFTTSGMFTATISATNAKGKSASITANLDIDDQAPTISDIAINPPTIAAGQPAQITFKTSDNTGAAPDVRLTPPDASIARHAAQVNFDGTTWTYQFIPLSTDPVGTWKVQIFASDAEGNSSSSPGDDSFSVVGGGSSSTVAFSAVRHPDSATGDTAFYLKSGASMTLTATFGASLSSAPGAFLCPAGASSPCTATSGGVQTLTATGNGSTWSIEVPAISKVTAPTSNEGNHVLTVAGTSAAGASISGNVTLIYDFTAPAFSMVILNTGALEYDHTGERYMVSKTGTEELDFAASIQEPLSGLSSVTAKVDGQGAAIDPDPSLHQAGILPQFSLTLDGSLASRPPVLDPAAGHYLEGTICDLAGNCAVEDSSPAFVEVDLTPATIGYIPGDPPATVYKAGDEVEFTLAIDRELSTDPLAAPLITLARDATDDAVDAIASLDDTNASVVGDGGTALQYPCGVEIASDVQDGTYGVMIQSGYDGYGNPLTLPETPLFTGFPTIQIKTSTPSLLVTNSAGGILSPAQNQANLSVSPGGSTTLYVASQKQASSWSTNGALDDLTAGTLALCNSPVISGSSLSCAAGSSTSAPGDGNAISASVNVTSAIDGKSVAAVNINATASAQAGTQFFLLTYTDAAGHLASMPINVAVTKGPQLISWSLDKTNGPPKSTFNLTVVMSDSFGLNPPAALFPSADSAITTNVTAGGGGSGSSVYVISYTLPSTCTGGGGTPSGSSFPIGFKEVDAAGNQLLFDPNAGTGVTQIACNPTPHVSSVVFNTTTLPEHGTATATVTVDEPLGSIPGGRVTGSVGSGPANVTTSTATTTNPYVFNVSFTVPACDGENGDPSINTPFTVYALLADGSGGATQATLGKLTCQQPMMLSYTWDKTVIAPGQTATATLVVNEPMTQVFPIPSVSAGITFSPASGSAIAGSAPQTYIVTVTANACGGTNQPQDGVPFAVSATLSDGTRTMPGVSLGSLTCSTTSVAGSTIKAANIGLIKQPMFDGTVRSLVYASPGALTGYSGTGAGIQLVAYSGGAQVGAGPFLTGDKSVAEFELSAGQTQVTLQFQDLLGNAKTVPAYAEQLIINSQGLSASGSSNPFRVYDVTSGSSTLYAPGWWLDAGPGPTGSATLLTSAQDDQLGWIDSSVFSIPADGGTSVLGPFVLDGGTGVFSYAGAEQFGNPMTDGGVVTSPVARQLAMMTAGSAYLGSVYNYDTVYMVGGINGSTAADLAGTLWTWNRESGWNNQINGIVAGAGTLPTYGAVLAIDNNQQLYTIGGNSAAGTVLSNVMTLTGSPAAWQATGNIGQTTLANDGGVSAFAYTITGSASGSAPFNIPPVTNSSNYGFVSFAAVATNTTGNNNCLIYLPQNSMQYLFGSATGAGVYSCLTGLNSSLWNNRDLPGMAISNEFCCGSGVTRYGLFAFGGKSITTGTYLSDLIAGTLTYGNGNVYVNWTTMPAANGGPTARTNAQLYMNPDNARLELFGGVNSAGTVLTDSWEYDFNSSAWYRVDDLRIQTITAPYRGSGTVAGVAASASWEGNLYMFGGISGGQVTNDAWTVGRSTRERLIAKVPIATQLSSVTTAQVADLQVNLGLNYNSRGNVNRAIGAAASPDLIPNDFVTGYDLYAWSGTNWTYLTTINENTYGSNSGSPQKIVITASLLPSILTTGTGDGNLYFMLAGPMNDYVGNSPSPIVLDSLSFTLDFQ